MNVNVKYFDIHLGEKRAKGFDFAARLPTGVTLGPGTAKAVQMDTGQDVTDDVLDDDVVTPNGTQASVIVEGIAINKDYLITLSMTTNQESPLVEQMVMQVRN